MILTSNQSFNARSEVSGDRVIATTSLNRLLHYDSTIVKTVLSLRVDANWPDGCP